MEIQIQSKYGQYTILKVLHGSILGLDDREYAVCKCDCGNTRIVRLSCLVDNTSKSCGHKGPAKPRIQYVNRLRVIWRTIKFRCYNEKCEAFQDYGGRGIYMDDTWRSDFKEFHSWSMLNGYQSNLEIDRKDNNAGYFPGNCRWVTQKENVRNKRNNSLITFNGRTECIAKWSELTGIDASTISRRLHCLKWPTDKILGEAVKKGPSIKIGKYDTSGNLVGVFVGASQAAKSVNGSDSCIHQCLRGRNKKHKGFVWARV